MRKRLSFLVQQLMMRRSSWVKHLTKSRPDFSLTLDFFSLKRKNLVMTYTKHSSKRRSRKITPSASLIRLRQTSKLSRVSN